MKKRVWFAGLCLSAWFLVLGGGNSLAAVPTEAESGELDWSKFLSLARSLLQNPVLATSNQPGATIIALGDIPTGDELSELAVQLGMNPRQYVRYVLLEVLMGEDDEEREEAKAGLEEVVRIVQEMIDCEGQPIGDRLQVYFVQDLIEGVRHTAQELILGKASFKDYTYVNALVSEGMAVRFQQPFIATLVEIRVEEEHRLDYASVRNLVAMRAAQLDVRSKNLSGLDLLNKQAGSKVLGQDGNFFWIDGKGLGTLAKSWFELMRIRDTSIVP